jgi:hypothetical protein
MSFITTVKKYIFEVAQLIEPIVPGFAPQILGPSRITCVLESE